jgi:cytochrome d ubiquinol oxidase subunit II
LISRAVSFEFRSKEESSLWRSTWDAVFSISSILAGLLFGVALGNVMRGIPLDASGNYTGGFLDLLNTYALMIGILSLSMFAFQGANFIALKSTGNLSDRSGRWAFASGIVYLVLFIAASYVTIAGQPHLMENFTEAPVLWAIPVLAFAFVVASILFCRMGSPGKAFLFSSLSIAGMMGTTGAALFPRLVPALNNLNLSLTAANSSSSELTLKTMLVLTLIGVPIVLGYTVWVYRAFRGKVDPDHESNHY